MKNKLNKIKFLKRQAQKIRKDVLEISFRAKVGHIASAFSIADILTVLYQQILKIDPLQTLNPLRDRFILSKGHAAAALYAALHRVGFISRKKLLTFCQNGGVIGVHPDYNPQLGIEFSTGSLGHGLSVGAGLALGLRSLRKNKKAVPRVFVLISDAELNEGSTWEAIMFAAHHRLDNLIAIVDNNKLQALGRTREILNLYPLVPKWEAFGWRGKAIDGHDLKKLSQVLTSVPLLAKRPSVIIANTIGGKGVSFMEDNYEWHYWPLNKNLYKKALKEVSKA